MTKQRADQLKTIGGWLSAIAIAFSLTTAVLAEWVVPRTLDAAWPKIEARIDLHEKHPHTGSVTREEFGLIQREVLSRLERIENAVDDLRRRF